MYRLITPYILLTGLQLASAQAEVFNVTSGSMVVQYLGQQAPYTFAGPDFSTSGVVLFSGGITNPLNDPFPPGQFGPNLTVLADTGNPNLTSVSLTVHGVPFAMPTNPADSGSAFTHFRAATTAGITSPGTYFSTFTLDSGFIGVPVTVLSANPGATCTELMCSRFRFDGGGSIEFEVIPYAPIPGDFVVEQATFTFKPVPEPSAASLLVIAFTGLAILGRRRRSHATLLPAW